MTDEIPPRKPLPYWRSLVAIAAMAGSMLVAFAGAELWKACHLPLPWLVGSLYAVAFARMAGLPLQAPPGARQGGQWVIGTNMGLYFTSAVLAQLLDHTLLIAGMALTSLLMGMLAAAALVRLRLADLPTAFFACMPGGASEMANLSDLWHAAVDKVAAAHAVRVMLVVLIVPLVLTWTASHGDAASAMPPRPVDWLQFPLMIGVSLSAVALMMVLDLPNAWVLGTLAGIGSLGVAGVSLSALPPWLTASGQLLIGVALGNRFSPGFLRRSPAFLAGIAVVSLMFIIATGVLSLPLSGMTGVQAAGIMLSFAPGGIAEMSITASQLNLAVPLVVASHIARLVLLMVLATPAFRLFSSVMARKIK